MGYRNLRQCVEDLRKHGRLVRIDDEIDARLEAAEIQRRVYAAGGPAVYFANVKNCRFPMVSNLFGSLDQARFLFRDTIDQVKRLIELKIDPNELWKRPLRYVGAPLWAMKMMPSKRRSGPVLKNQTKIDQLPQLISWPDDGGAYVTLPQVYTEDIGQPGAIKSNLGMYRVQLGGNQYVANEEIGLHYQLHRGIGVHHAAALAAEKPFHANIFVGGTPAMSLAAVMPLPEGLSELSFAGALAGHRIPMVSGSSSLPLYSEADFCIAGTLSPQTKPEGPFGDHLGYYSLIHDFPVLQVKQVYHRDDAIWPFTVVGRPPQEDTTFGALIHEITGPIIPTVLPGVKAVHAVDAAGVHPLMLAIGSERYVPYDERTRPKELLTQANAILGQGQMSLAKYLMIVASEDDPSLEIHNFPRFCGHLLERIDWRRDLHFQTETTIDTLDYSSGQFNHGSKLVMAAVGRPVRELYGELPRNLSLPDGFHTPKIALRGVMVVQGPAFQGSNQIEQFCEAFDREAPINQLPLIVIVDDSPFAAASLNNFVWTLFTRSNPAADVHGIEAFTTDKHWGCHGSLVIDARLKPWNAPPLVEDSAVSAKIDALAARGGAIAKYL